MATSTKTELLRRFDVSVRSAFNESYNGNKYKESWPLVAAHELSDSATNIYPSAIDAAQVREWIGERIVNGIALDGAQVTNKKFELTYSVRREDLDDDAKGALRAGVKIARGFATKYLKHRDTIVYGVIKGNGVALDRVPLFGTHKIDPTNDDSETYSNTATGTPLTANSAADARAKMLELKGADGHPVNLSPGVLLVPPALELTARKIAQADIVLFAGGASESNVYRGLYTVISEPRLAASFAGNDSTWYMLDAEDPSDRSVILQDRDPVEIVAKFNPEDEKAFDLDVFVWGSRARYVAAGGNPKKIRRHVA